MDAADEIMTRVLAAVVLRYGRYLVCRRPAHKRHGGLWEFPGGKLEPGESLLDAANRELTEELNVSVVSVGEPIYSAHDVQKARFEKAPNGLGDVASQ